MDWKEVAGAVARFAPILGGAIGGPVGGAIGTGVSLAAKALGVEPEPAAIMQALQTDPEAAVKLRQVEATHEQELARIAANREIAELEAESFRLAEVNATMREEAKSEDPFVRRARPAFLWVTVFSIFVEVVIALIVVLNEPERIGDLATLFGALTIPQGIAAAVCGVYMKKRSDDKQVMRTGQAPPATGLLTALLGSTR